MRGWLRASGAFTPGNFFVSTSLSILATGSVALTAVTDAQIVPLHAHVSSTANNLFVIFWTDAQGAQNNYFQVATNLYPAFERPLRRRLSAAQERLRCYERYRTINMTVTTASVYVSLSPQMLKPPTVTATVGTIANAGADLSHPLIFSPVIPRQ